MTVDFTIDGDAVQLVGAATGGEDCELYLGGQINKQVVIPQGETSIIVEVRPIDDDEVEDQYEDVILTLVDSPGAAYVVGGSDSATVEIEDDNRYSDDPHFCECTPSEDLRLKIQQQVGAVATKVAAAILNPLGAALHLVGLSNSNPQLRKRELRKRSFAKGGLRKRGHSTF